MAIFRAGGVVSAISGNLGGTNFVLGKQGPYCRRATPKKQMSSVTQLEHRRAMAIALSFWRDMSEPFKLSWRKFAELMPFTNRLGITRNINGFQLFCRYVCENYPKETDFDIQCRVIEKTPKPTLDAFLPLTTTWYLYVNFPTRHRERMLKIWCSRPVSSSRKTHYSNWFLIYWDLEGPIWNIIQQDPNFHLRLQTWETEEIVSLKIRQKFTDVAGTALYSAPVYTTPFVE